MKPNSSQSPLYFTSSDLARRRIERRGVEAALWGVPIVSVHAMREAFFRDAKAHYGDIVFTSKPSDWKFQMRTPNASTHYVYFNFNLKHGPLVLEIPPAHGAGLFGTVLDAWQVPLFDVGPEGRDRGGGGRYLVLPPGHRGDVPAELFVARSVTFNGYALFRVIPITTTALDVAGALALVKQIRVYPLSKAHNPPEQSYVDVSGHLLDGVTRFDETFFDRLAEMLREEPVATRDLVAHAQLRSLELDMHDPGKRDLLAAAAIEAHAELIAAVRNVEPFWPGSKWGLHLHSGPMTGFSFAAADGYDIDERALVYYLAFATTAQLGAATFYLTTVSDAVGEPLAGERTYRLHVPPHVPARQYWAVTVYDLETCTFLRDVPRPGVDSYDQRLQKNADGSLDVWFGPRPPAGRESNWIPTLEQRQWFTMFRFYAPDKPLFDKEWTLPAIERQAA